MAKGGGFQDFSDDLMKEAYGISDADLEKLLLGGAGPSGRQKPGIESLEPGARVEGVVVDFRGGEILVELDGKTLGVIPESEFEGQDLPRIGSRIRGQLERYDRTKDLAHLSVGGVRREVAWEELRRGTVIEGVVTATNKGGLTLDVKGIRAFLPISQVERERVADLAPYVGRKLRCEVTEVDSAARNLVVSRRLVLDREIEAERAGALARLSEGEVLKGVVARVNDFGAFVSLGSGVDGLIPASKITTHLKAKTIAEPLKEGQQVQVQVVRVERERARVSLDLKVLEADSWAKTIEGYAPGDTATGWVSKRTPVEVTVRLDEGVEGVIPEAYARALGDAARPGAIIKVEVASVDAAAKRIVLRPASQYRRPCPTRHAARRSGSSR